MERDALNAPLATSPPVNVAVPVAVIVVPRLPVAFTVIVVVMLAALAATHMAVAKALMVNVRIILEESSTLLYARNSKKTVHTVYIAGVRNKWTDLRSVAPGFGAVNGRGIIRSSSRW